MNAWSRIARTSLASGICSIVLITMSCATSGATRPTTTRNARGAGGNADRRAGVAALVLIVIGVSACAVQPRMTTVRDLAPSASPNPGGARDCRQISSGSPVRATWIVPDDPRHRQQLDAVCAGVGPVVVQAGPASTRREAGEFRAPLVVVDWNTYL